MGMNRSTRSRPIALMTAALGSRRPLMTSDTTDGGMP